MDFNELKNTILKDFNDSNHKCYNDLNCIRSSYSRKKALKNNIINVTNFVDDNFHVTKKVPEPPMSLRIYCIINDINSDEKYPRCPICNKPRIFISIIDGFGISCGNRKCYQKLDEVNKKRQTRAKENYGSLKGAYHNTMKETVQNLYNTDNVSKLDWVKDKKINTSREIWGTDYPWQSDKGKYLQKYGVQTKYNVDNISKLPQIKRKKVETSMKNWGVDNPSKSPEVLNRIVSKWVEKYGVENISQCLKIHRKKVDKVSNIYKTKNGKEYLYEGNEIIFLKKLIELYGEKNVYSQPELFIEYYDEDSKFHVWFPDFNVIESNLEYMIEAKFLWNLKCSGRINLLKCKLLNNNSKYKYKLLICDDNLSSKPIYEVFLGQSIKETWYINPLTKNKESINKTKGVLENLGFKNIVIKEY